jgi:hypothetical protein
LRELLAPPALEPFAGRQSTGGSLLHGQADGHIHDPGLRLLGISNAIGQNGNRKGGSEMTKIIVASIEEVKGMTAIWTKITFENHPKTLSVRKGCAFWEQLMAYLCKQKTNAIGAALLLEELPRSGGLIHWTKRGLK